MPVKQAEQAQYLEEAFGVFNRMSVQLESSYRDLENQMSVLNRELAASRSERLKTLAEKEILAIRLGRLLELLPGAVLVLDGEGCITQVNPMAEELLEPGLEGKQWFDVMKDHFNPDFGERGEVTLISGRHVSISMSDPGAEPGQVVLLMDVSDEHELKELLNRQDRLAEMGEMSASLAHQIRTPLATAMLYVTSFNNEKVLPAERQRMAGKVLECLKHLEQMVNDMLRFTRGGKSTTETFALKDLLEEFRQVIEPQLFELDGSLILPSIIEDIQIQGDRKDLLGAFLNLASNAIQSSGQHSHIILELIQVSNGFVRILFSDNGQGINKEIRGRIFSPFFTTRPEGTGLGLAIVQSSIIANRGEIKLLNSSDGGAVFEITLPLTGPGPVLTSGMGKLENYENKQTHTVIV